MHDTHYTIIKHIPLREIPLCHLLDCFTHKLLSSTLYIHVCNYIYTLHCMYMYVGLPGKPGNNGTPGEPGMMGKTGDKGEKGMLGDKGEKGTDGQMGPQGNTVSVCCMIVYVPYFT